MGSHSVTCHPAEVMFPLLPQSIKARTRFSDPGDARLSRPSWLGYIPRWYAYARPKTVTRRYHYTNRQLRKHSPSRPNRPWRRLERGRESVLSMNLWNRWF